MATTNNTVETNLGFIIEQVAKEKGIDPALLTKTIETAILKAAQNIFGDTREFDSRFNEEKGQVDLFLYMTVVEEVERPEREIALEEVRKRGLEAELGEELGFQVFWHQSDALSAKQQDAEYGDLLGLKQARSTFGRIAAQTAKQVMLTGIREAERDLIYNEFKDKEGKLIKGIVRRFEKGNNIIVDLGKTEGVLPSKEQTPRETYRPNDRIVALVKHIDREGKGPPVVLSRQDPRLVGQLFEAEVPEIYDNIVRIMSVAREPGARSKIAVASHHSDVDPVGACVGMKGSRVQAVVQELRGEKVDIVPYDPDPAKFVINAVQPAEVTKVIVDSGDQRMELVVPDEKLSLAIGRKGQNVRLASQLTGWKLDIISETRFRQLEEESLRGLQQIEGVSDETARALYRAGFRSPEELADADIDDLASTGAVDDAGAQNLHDVAAQHIEKIRQERLAAAHKKTEALSDREKLALIPGIGDRTVDLLIEAGYHTPEGVAREEEERLAYRVGLNNQKASQLKAAAQQLLDTDWKTINAVRIPRRTFPGGRLTYMPLPSPSVSQRTCVGCSHRDTPRGMLRLLFGEGKDAVKPGMQLPLGLSPGPRAAGRGVHLHPRQECIQRAVKKGLPRALRRQVNVRPDEITGLLKGHLEAALGRALGAAGRQKALRAPGADTEESSLRLRALDASLTLSYPATGQVMAGTRQQLGRLVARPETEELAIVHRGLAARVRKICELASGAGIGGLEVG
jgi:N utilization substance protein A